MPAIPEYHSLTPEALDALERAVRERRRVALMRRGTEYVVVAERLETTGPRAPLAGLEASGWRLVYTEAPNDLIKATESANDVADFTYSLGFRVRRKLGDENDGTVLDVIPGMPAAQAGLAPGMKLVAVNGRRWSPVVLREALRTARAGPDQIKLLLENADYYTTFVVDYRGGDRQPHLERDPSRPDLLSEIIEPRSAR